MGKIKINISNIQSLNSNIVRVKNSVSSIKNDVSSLGKKVDVNITSKSYINDRLQKIVTDLGNIEAKLNAVNKTVEYSVNSYNSVENKVSSMAREIRNEKTNVHRVFNSVVAGGQTFTADQLRKQTSVDKKNPVEGILKTVLMDKGEVSRTSALYSTDPGNETNYINVGEIKNTSSLSTLYGSYKNKKLIGDLTGNRVKQESKSLVNNLEGESFYGDPQATLWGRNITESHEVNLLDGKETLDWKIGEGTVQARVGSAEWHKSAEMGLYVYSAEKNGNIKKIFSPGVSAEVGGSASVLRFNADGTLLRYGEGVESIGIYGKVDAQVLSAEARTKVSLNSNEIYAGASAEANLVKAGGSTGLSILGTKIGISGAVKVGVGGHAEVGVTDGKFKADIGGALGPGVDLGLEIDTSGTVAAVSDAVQPVKDFAADAYQGITDWSYELGRNAYNWFNGKN